MLPIYVCVFSMIVSIYGPGRNSKPSATLHFSPASPTIPPSLPPSLPPSSGTDWAPAPYAKIFGYFVLQLYDRPHAVEFTVMGEEGGREGGREGGLRDVSSHVPQTGVAIPDTHFHSLPLSPSLLTFPFLPCRRPEPNGLK